VTDGSFSYTPNAGFTGTETISYTVSDGTVESTGQFTVTVEPQAIETVRIGDAPSRITSTSQLVAAWTDPLVSGIEHTADASVAAPGWSAAQLSVLNVGVLAGGDIYNGDLGVSGQSAATSAVKQEIDGTEALRFNLEAEASGVRVDLSRFYINDDSAIYYEAGRLRLLDASGNVVGETTFVADSSAGEKTVSIGSAGGFTAVELSAGVYDGDTFIFGGYADGNGDFASGVFADIAGKQHGSDFLVDWIEFDFPAPVIGIGDGFGG